MSSIDPEGIAPALLIKISTRPASAKTRWIFSLTERSASTIDTATFETSDISVATASKSALVRETRVTSQPSRARQTEIAAPMPRDAPVIRARRPVSSSSNEN